jgi:hypothetical protein
VVATPPTGTDGRFNIEQVHPAADQPPLAAGRPQVHREAPPDIFGPAADVIGHD